MFRQFNHRESTPLIFKKKTLTEQHHAQESDINRIVQRYDATGMIPEGKGEGQFLDVTHLQENLTDMMNNSHETLDAHYAELREKEIQEKEIQEKELQELQEKAQAFDKLQENVDNTNLPD